MVYLTVEHHPLRNLQHEILQTTFDTFDQSQHLLHTLHKSFFAFRLLFSFHLQYIYIFKMDFILFFFNFWVYLFIYLFIDCVGSSFLCEGFLQLRRAGATLHRDARASH